MTPERVLVLAWLVLAHLVADFILQTDRMVADKSSSSPRRQWRGLAAHGGAVAVCLVPFAVAFGTPGIALLVVVSVSHALIDRWKVQATRRAEARALAEAHRRHEIDGDTDGLGPAWTPVPGALFVVDQVFHLAVLGAAWAVLLAPVAPLLEWSTAVERLAGRVGGEQFHAWVLFGVVAASLLIVNVRAGALFVATLVRPREAVTGVAAPDGAATASSPAPNTPEARPVGWRVRIGPLVAIADPVATAAPAATTDPPRPAGASAHASPAQIGATIGILERLLIVTLVLTNATAAIGFVVAAKTLARFKQLDDRDFAEYYLLGTLASVAVAIGSALLAQAALGTLLPSG